MKSLLIFLVFTVLVLSAAPAGAVTYNIRVTAYCSTSTPNCRSWSEDDFKLHVRKSLAHTNRIWSAAGVAFRFETLNIVVDDTKAAWIGLDGSDAIEQAIASSAEADKTVIHWMTTEKMSYPAYSGPSFPGFFAPIDLRGERRFRGTAALGRPIEYPLGQLYQGQNVAHEIGHYFYLNHTFDNNDFAWAQQAGWSGSDCTPFDWGHPTFPGENPVPDFPSIGDLFAAPPALAPSQHYAMMAEPRRVYDGGVLRGWQYPDSAWTPANRYRYYMQTWFDTTQGFEWHNSFGLGPYKTTDSNPFFANVMSYYGKSNQEGYGPWGSKDKDQPLAACQKSVVSFITGLGRPRGGLADACLTSGGDHDLDGLCDGPPLLPEDKCGTGPGPIGMNFDDFDLDGWPAACDTCDDIPGTFIDSDGDGFGDPCDLDDDNDGCHDADDKEPLHSDMPHHYLAYDRARVECFPNGLHDDVVRASSAGNADGDLHANCSRLEPDSDGDGTADYVDVEGDGIPDDLNGDGRADLLDECPLIAGATKREECEELFCGDAEVPVAICGTDCAGYALEFVNPSRPLLRFENFVAQFGNTLFFRPEGRLTPHAAIQFITATLQAEAVDSPQLNSLQSNDDEPSEQPLVRIIKEGSIVREWAVDSAQLKADLSGFGHLIAFSYPLTPAAEGAFWVAVAPGEESARVGLDSDNDGITDAMDNCSCQPNPMQSDTDEDGWGDACDADFDNDGTVDAADIGFVLGCVGQNVSTDSIFISCGADTNAVLLPDEQANSACWSADLNSDGEIDQADVDIAYSNNSPGPSVFHNWPGECSG